MINPVSGSRVLAFEKNGFMNANATTRVSEDLFIKLLVTRGRCDKESTIQRNSIIINKR
jgi:hypothetical protein